MVTKLIQKYIPNIQPNCNLNNNLTYIIHEIDAPVLQFILQELENNKKIMNIENILLTSITLQEIFFDLGTEYPLDSHKQLKIKVINGISPYVEENEVPLFLKTYKYYTGWRLWKSQIKSIFIKRIMEAKKYYIFIIFILIMTWLTPILLRIKLAINDLGVLHIQLDYYKKSFTIIDVRRDLQNGSGVDYYRAYSNVIFRYGVNHHQHLDLSYRTFEEIYRFVRKTSDNPAFEYIIGASFSRNRITGYFNNLLLHSAPLTLRAIHSAFLM